VQTRWTSGSIARSRAGTCPDGAVEKVEDNFVAAVARAIEHGHESAAAASATVRGPFSGTNVR
jgi:hypothetical protein